MADPSQHSEETASEELLEGKKKRNRSRTKDLLRKIKDQVEFYFSDINLNRDGFLNRQMNDSEDGFVPVEMIASFNRMKVLTTDTSLIAKAMRRSDLLEVSVDGTKVRRTAPVSRIDSTNDRTLYVEELQPNTTIDSLKKDFCSCGTVEYINLPRMKDTKDLKGYAWITFKDEDSVLNALQVFDTFESGLEPLHPPPTPTTAQDEKDTQDSKIVVAEKDRQGNKSKKEKSKGRKRAKKVDKEDCKSKVASEIKLENEEVPNVIASVPEKLVLIETQQRNPSKRSFSDLVSSEDTLSEEPPSKKEKANSPSEETILVSETPKAEDKAKLRKHKKKKSQKSAKTRPPYRVLHQLEWVRLKKLYVKLQKQEMATLKQHITKGAEAVTRNNKPVADEDAFCDPVQTSLQDAPKRGADKILKKMFSST